MSIDDKDWSFQLCKSDAGSRGFTLAGRKSDIVGKLKIGPKSGKRHGVCPMVLDDFDLHVQVSCSS